MTAWWSWTCLTIGVESVLGHGHAQLFNVLEAVPVGGGVAQALVRIDFCRALILLLLLLQTVVVIELEPGRPVFPVTAQAIVPTRWLIFQAARSTLSISQGN